VHDYVQETVSAVFSILFWSSDSCCL